jgi:hypothetical protein
MLAWTLAAELKVPLADALALLLGLDEQPVALRRGVAPLARPPLRGGGG